MRIRFLHFTVILFCWIGVGCSNSPSVEVPPSSVRNQRNSQNSSSTDSQKVFSSFLTPQTPSFLKETLALTQRTLDQAFQPYGNSQNPLRKDLQAWVKAVSKADKTHQLNQASVQAALKKEFRTWRLSLFWPGKAQKKKHKNQPRYWDLFGIPSRAYLETNLDVFQQVIQVVWSLFVALDLQYPEGHWLASLIGQALTTSSFEAREGHLADLDPQAFQVDLSIPFQDDLAVFSQASQHLRVKQLQGDFSELGLSSLLNFRHTAIQSLSRGGGLPLSWWPLTEAARDPQTGRDSNNLQSFLGRWAVTIPWVSQISVPDTSVFVQLVKALHLPPAAHWQTRVFFLLSPHMLPLTLEIWKPQSESFYPFNLPQVKTIDASGHVVQYFLTFQWDAQRDGRAMTPNLWLPPVLLVNESDCKTPEGCLRFTSRLVPFKP